MNRVRSTPKQSARTVSIHSHQHAYGTESGVSGSPSGLTAQENAEKPLPAALMELSLALSNAECNQVSLHNRLSRVLDEPEAGHAAATLTPNLDEAPLVDVVQNFINRVHELCVSQADILKRLHV